MRSRRHTKTKNNTYRQKISKRRYKSRSTLRSLGCTQNISIFDLENINEVLRVHKTQLAEGKGAWKVVPKDSCEVYKDRRKRQAESSNKEADNDDYSMSENDEYDGRRTQKKQSDKKVKKNTTRKRRQRRKTGKRRRSKQRSESTSLSTTSTYSSCFSSSEMDCYSN